MLFHLSNGENSSQTTKVRRPGWASFGVIWQSPAWSLRPCLGQWSLSRGHPDRLWGLFLPLWDRDWAGCFQMLPTWVLGCCGCRWKCSETWDTLCNRTDFGVSGHLGNYAALFLSRISPDLFSGFRNRFCPCFSSGQDVGSRYSSFTKKSTSFRTRLSRVLITALPPLKEQTQHHFN